MKFRLIESKADQQKLIDFAGEKIATQFFDNRKLYKSPENDIYYWLKKSPEELKDFMEKHKTVNQKTKSEIEQILEMPAANDVDLIAKQDGYTIYKINTPEASVKYGLVVGGKAGWCISGGYYDGKEDGKILEEARHYFEEYLDTTYEAYYFIIGHRTKYALCVRSVDDNQAEYDIWDKNDDPVSDIPDLSDLYDGNVLLYAKEIEFRISNGTLVKFNNVNNVSEVTIPDRVTSIGDGAFFDCTELTSVTLGNSVTSIENAAFYGCSGLTSITIPDRVKSIGGHAFSHCSSLASITIPDSVTSIGDHAFYECYDLTSVTIPDSVTNISDDAFAYCSSLTSITFKGTKSQWQRMTDNVDLGINTDKCVIHCTDGDIQTSKNESYTLRFKRRLK